MKFIRHHLTPVALCAPLHDAQQNGHLLGKPSGLWYEVNADWRRWCQSEQPNWMAGRLLYRIVLDPAAKVLFIRTCDELDQFEAEYGGAKYGAKYGAKIKFSRLGEPDWGAVAARYDGIEIAPYVWERRLEVWWYYGWDCASGCLWRPKATKIHLVCTLPGGKL